MKTFLKHPPTWFVKTFKISAWIACIAPFAATIWQLYTLTQGNNTLGANPIETVIRRLGEVALILLVCTMSVTPLRKILQAPWLLQVRRLLGVSTFAYASLHLLSYAGWDQAFSLEDILRDTAKRPFVFVGMAAWLLMLPLAATSFNRAIRWLGGKRWQTLHRAIYAVALLAPLHFWWIKSGKNDFSRPALYAVLLIGLLAYRVWVYLVAKRQRTG